MGGKPCLEVKTKTGDWTGTVLAGKILPLEKADWFAYKAIRMIVRGSGSRDAFFVFIEDRDLEQFSYFLIDNWIGWKEIVIPIQQFHSRIDWQTRNVKINYKIDYPVHSFHFCSFNYGHMVLAFDRIEVVK